MSTGSLIGGILGAVGGTMVAPGVGTSAGYALGSAIGGTAEGMGTFKRGQQMMVDKYTPQQQLILQDIIQRRKAMESGQYFMPQQTQLLQAGQGAMRRATSVAGGDVGGTMSALKNIHRGTGRNLTDLYGQMMTGALGLMQQEGQQAKQLYDQRFSVQAWDKQQQMAHGARMLQNAMATLGGSMARGGQYGQNPSQLEELLNTVMQGRNNQAGGGVPQPNVIGQPSGVGGISGALGDWYNSIYGYGGMGGGQQTDQIIPPYHFSE